MIFATRAQPSAAANIISIGHSIPEVGLVINNTPMKPTMMPRLRRIPTFSPKIGTEVMAKNNGKEKNNATAVASGKCFNPPKKKIHDRMLINVRASNKRGRFIRREMRSPVAIVLAPRKAMPNKLRKKIICNTATSTVSHLIPASWIEKQRPPIIVIIMPIVTRLLRGEVVLNGGVDSCMAVTEIRQPLMYHISGEGHMTLILGGLTKVLFLRDVLWISSIKIN